MEVIRKYLLEMRPEQINRIPKWQTKTAVGTNTVINFVTKYGRSGRDSRIPAAIFETTTDNKFSAF